ncbi:6094_t:CDS:2 [Paraglomus occultum]|uniref:6094_t:CDS:1 n=1 Tax=Paraglomus occultum TaxID=144539 RepID=A0A9N8Z8P7_9GLOM|nr:6094_t:CDS:2 [Paraglomus occultum]
MEGVSAEFPELENVPSSQISLTEASHLQSFASATECNTEPFEFDKSIDEYLKSLELIKSQQDARRKKASLLLDRYREASYLLSHEPGLEHRWLTGLSAVQGYLLNQSWTHGHRWLTGLSAGPRPDYHSARKWEKDRCSNKAAGYSINIRNSTVCAGNSFPGGSISCKTYSDNVSKRDKENQEESADEQRKKKRSTKISDYFPCDDTHKFQHIRGPFENVDTNVYSTQSPCPPTGELLTHSDNTFFEKEDDIASINDVPPEMSFELGDASRHYVLGGVDVSQLFRSYKNHSLELGACSWSRISSLLDEIHKECLPMQRTVLDPNCESTFRKAIKMAVKYSCEDATNWLCDQLVHEKALRGNAGYVILDSLRTLPMLRIRSDHSEMTHITNYFDRIMRGFFDSPNEHIVQWPNTALEESKIRAFEGRTKQPDFITSVVHQLHTKTVLFVGEVSPPSQKNNTFKNCNDLIRVGIFMKDCLDSAIDKGADVKVLGFQCIGKANNNANNNAFVV